jgi:hypothetical protein
MATYSMIQQGQGKENIFTYHEVFAHSLAVIQDLIKMRQTNEAKEMVLFNYVYANALNGDNYSKEKIDELRRKDIYELLYLMVHAQKRVDLIPTQNNMRDSYYTRIIRKIKGEV